jgi:hypothetical protein
MMSTLTRIVTNEPAPDVFICADADTPGTHFVAFSFSPGLIMELILLALALYKACQNWDIAGGKPWHRRSRQQSSNGVRLMNILAWDAILYFFPIFGVFVGMQILWFFNDVSRMAASAYDVFTLAFRPDHAD